jgi:DNA-binding beta-propeller fold protein YncE
MNIMVKINSPHLNEVSTLAGTFGCSGDRPRNGDGTQEADGAQFNHPNGVAVDAFGNVIVVDTNNHRIRKITREGVVSTLAGSGTRGHLDNHENGLLAEFYKPHGVVIAPDGNIFVTDTFNHRIRKITPDGKASH